MDQPKPEMARRANEILSRTVLVIDIALLILLGYFACSPLVTFRELFEDFGTDLPIATKWLAAIPGWAYLTVLVGMAAALIIKEFLVRSPSIRLLMNLAAALTLLVLASATMIAFFQPLIELLDQLG